MEQIKQIYSILLNEYGKQGWWPIINNKTLLCEYHRGVPRSEEEILEICIGAILTQSTSWKNVVKALINLKKNNLLNKKELKSINTEKLARLIKPAGYFNQKAKKLKEFTKFCLSLKGKTPTREELLNIWGIGKETADSMLLYTFKIPTFVIDAYTRRIFTNLGFIDEKADYDKIKALFEDNLKPDLITYQEYHALLVEHAKQHCKVKPVCDNCPLNMLCKSYKKIRTK